MIQYTMNMLEKYHPKQTATYIYMRKMVIYISKVAE